MKLFDYKINMNQIKYIFISSVEIILEENIKIFDNK